MFVTSHIEALRKKKGDASVEELERRMGKPLHFGALEPVPIREEVVIIEHTLDLISEHVLEGAARSRAAGRLHFQNFTDTPLGSALLRSLPHTPTTFRTLMRSAPAIARTVFAHTTFTYVEEEGAMCMTISNCDYPIEHFAGFFEAWMEFWELPKARVEYNERLPRTHEYRLYT